MGWRSGKTPPCTHIAMVRNRRVTSQRRATLQQHDRARTGRGRLQSTGGRQCHFRSAHHGPRGLHDMRTSSRARNDRDVPAQRAVWRGVMSGGGNMGAGRASFSLSPACLSSCSAPAQCTHVVSSRPRTISTNPNPRTRLICVGSGEQEVRGETLHHGDDGGLGGVLGRVIDHVDVRAATARQPPGRPPSFVFEFIDVYRHDRGP